MFIKHAALNITGRSLRKLFPAISLMVLASLPAVSQDDQPSGGFINTRILFVFDASQSMAGTWESDTKINIARNFLISIVDSLENLENVQMALRVYGHQSPVPPQDCNDTKLEVPFDINNAFRIRQKLKFIKPKGTTPIAHSLELAAKDFTDCDECRNIIILITDGIEACDGDPCEVSRQLQLQGITLKPFIIGIGMDPDFKKTFDCVGYYYNADKEEKFKEVLDVVITMALNSTSAQINLLDEDGRPTETDVNMTFYDQVSGKVRQNIVHTLNQKGNPDTIMLDPLATYRIRINTIPPVYIDTVRVTAGKHTVIGADAPQGYLEFTTSGRIQYRDLRAIIRRPGDMETLNYQGMNQNIKYLTGRYDIEIPTMPKILLYDVEIRQSHTTTIEIPRSGIATFMNNQPGYGSLYVWRNGDMEWVTNLPEKRTNQSLILQPGSYTVVFRPKYSKNSQSTVKRRFDIVPGSSIAVELD
jgi:Ca-activated chloride channel family protein